MFLIMQFEKSMFFKMGSSDVLTSPFALLLFVFNLQFEESVFLRLFNAKLKKSTLYDSRLALQMRDFCSRLNV